MMARTATFYAAIRTNRAGNVALSFDDEVAVLPAATLLPQPDWAAGALL